VRCWSVTYKLLETVSVRESFMAILDDSRAMGYTYQALLTPHSKVHGRCRDSLYELPKAKREEKEGNMLKE
jgi:hypothetical protein